MMLPELLRAAAEPLTRLSLLLAMLLFWLLGAFGLALYHLFAHSDAGVGLIGVIGLALVAVVTVPAVLRYILLLIEERATRRAPPLPDASLFAVFSAPRRLFPVVILALLALMYAALWPHSPRAAGLITVVAGIVILPLHAVLLALTDSPLQSVHPLAIWRLQKRLLPGCLWWLPFAAAAVLSWRWLAANDAAGFWLLLLSLYWLLALANICGVLVARIDVAAETDIPAPQERAPRRGNRNNDKAQQAALSHAYALISRGNRDGGFAHLDGYAAATAEPLLTRFAMFNTMLGWDLADTALHYAQSLLPALLDAGQHAMALKVTVQCLHRNERFRPHAADIPRLQKVAEREGHQDVLRALSRQ